MTPTIDPERDLTISRVIKAPRQRVWEAWANPASFEKWWIPAPAICKVLAMDLQPGGALETQMSEHGGEFGPHMSACFLDIVDGERIVFTTALTGGWRPATQPFITAIISFADHPDGTEYASHVMHKSSADKAMHAELGFYDGWGTVIAQLAGSVERG